MADPRAVAQRWPEPRLREIAALTVAITETPWMLDRAAHAAARAAGLDDEAVLHLTALASYFGHLNRIADMVGVDLDYAVAIEPHRAEPATPALASAPHQVDGPPVIELERRPATAAALASWRTEIMDRGGPIAPPDRHRLAARATWLLGAGPTPPPPRDALGEALDALCDVVVLAPWRLVGADHAALRALGLDDRALFDACAIVSSTTAFARTDVALRALGQ